MQMNDTFKLLTRRELATVLRVQYRQVHKLTVARQIPFIKVGGNYRYELNAVIRALNEATERTYAESEYN